MLRTYVPEGKRASLKIATYQKENLNPAGGATYSVQVVISVIMLGRYVLHHDFLTTPSW